MEILNTKQVQEFLGISSGTTYKLLREKGCPLLNCGGQYRIIKEDLINWLKTKDKK